MCARAGRCPPVPAPPHPGHQPATDGAGRAGGHHRHLGLPAGPPLRGGLPGAAGADHRRLSARPAIVVIGDNDSIHHARTVRDFVAAHPGLHLWYSARYTPHDNPVERIWAALKAYLANTATFWPGRRRQLHAFFRSRSPDQNLTTATPWTSPWFPASYRQNF